MDFVELKISWPELLVYPKKRMLTLRMRSMNLIYNYNKVPLQLLNFFQRVIFCAPLSDSFLYGFFNHFHASFVCVSRLDSSYISAFVKH
ncbi:unnamed protein product [Rotaria socialis]